METLLVLLIIIIAIAITMKIIGALYIALIKALFKNRNTTEE